jgi:hypothetical protein
MRCMFKVGIDGWEQPGIDKPCRTECQTENMTHPKISIQGYMVGGGRIESEESSTPCQAHVMSRFRAS